MLLEMITKKILDFDLQLCRIFGLFLEENQYDNRETASGLYDIIICHRESAQDNFNDIEKYCHPKTKIVVDITTESGNIQPFFDKFTEHVNQSFYEFYLIIDSDVTNFLNKNKLIRNIKILYGFDLVFYAFLNKFSDNNLHNNNNIFATQQGFISLNNTARSHRLLVILELLRRNLDLSGVSWLSSTNKYGTGYVFDKDVHDSIIDNLNSKKLIEDSIYKKYLDLNIPLTLDYTNTTPILDLNNTINHLYTKIVNLVTENTMGFEDDDNEWNIVTFTEKIIKPYLAKQIPIFIGLYGLQESLRMCGFDMFDDIINFEFEKELNPIKRISLQVDELEKILKMDLVEYKKNNQHRFDYNYNLLQTLAKSGEEKVKSFLYEEILK
jgi:hypothetical protein